MKEESFERSYIAFISYRHLPLDKEAAERIQKKIENYTVPKEYREKFDGKKAGLVFRDEDELPASSSLTDSIYYALDHSEFLIVICTPDLPKSKWCEAEIRYFLKTHDRDHILAVLADGTPEESFSPYLLHEFDGEGNPISDTEPLAANIAGDDHRINKKTFNKEATRICAALIGCPFDALWQRERRARTNRLLTAAAAAVAVMAIFLGVVLNRNARIAEQSAQIQEQNDQIVAQNDELTQKNTEIQEQNEKIEEQNKELASRLSSVRVDSGFTRLKDHDVNGALTDALAAMESGDPSIYDPRIEELLAEALGAYKTGQLQSELVYEQTTDIRQIRVTDDGQYAILADIVGTIRCLDLSSFEVVWESLIKDNYSEIYTNGLTDRVLVKGARSLSCFSLKDGSLLWFRDQDSPNYFQCISEDGSRFAVLDTKPGETGLLSSAEGSGGNDLFRPVYVFFLDSVTGEELGCSALLYDHYGVRKLSEEYQPKNYGSDFSSDNRYFCCSFFFEKTDEEAEDPSCKPRFVIDTQTYDVTAPAYFSCDEENYDLTDLYFGCDISDDGSRFIFAEYQLASQSLIITASTKTGDEYTHTMADDPLTFSLSMIKHDSSLPKLLQSIQPALFSENHLVLFSDRNLWIYDLHSGTILRDYVMDSAVCAARFTDRENEILEITTSDGLIQS
ncbi:MAG: TIR domain-containing protein, partial [Erysipelotrichaceae bacterium]|nr:TIR domain-containing protein [Erysipelotrichaceae bacterium]